MDNQKELVASELTEFYHFAKILRVLNWDIDSGRIKEAIALLDSYDLEALLRAFDLCREMKLNEYREQIINQKEINCDLKERNLELRIENLELKEKNRELETKIKESSVNSYNDAIARLNELKDGL